MVNEYLGKDIKLKGNDIQFSENKDFSIINDNENLAQAVSNRLLTIQGEYVLNDKYGSELNSDLGLPTKNFIVSGIQGHVVETLNQESRIKDFKITNIDVTNQSVNVSISITPIKTNVPFNMVFPFYLEAQ